MRRGMTSERLFRCEKCGWRGWLMPLVSIEGDPVQEYDAPDLQTVDEAVATSRPVARRAFSPRDLQ
jgi:hypothetical protein